MHAPSDHHADTGQRGRTPARWRATAASTAVVAAAALSLAAGAVPASAAGAYTVTNSGDNTVSVISAAQPVSGPIVSGYRANKCVADSGDSAANKTPITIAPCDGSPGQDWTVTGSGTIQVNGKCLDIYRDRKTNKAPVELYTCTGGANQQWQATAGMLVNPVSRKCLDDPRFRTTTGTKLEIYTCKGGANQQWKLP
jgi:hypothetical protein